MNFLSLSSSLSISLRRAAIDVLLANKSPSPSGAPVADGGLGVGTVGAGIAGVDEVDVAFGGAVGIGGVGIVCGGGVFPTEGGGGGVVTTRAAEKPFTDI